MHLKEKINDFWELKKIHTHDIAITNGQVQHWSLKINIYVIYFYFSSELIKGALDKFNIIPNFFQEKLGFLYH